jgi:hypothetical protein
MIAVLAISLPELSPTDTPSDVVTLPGAEAIYDETGVSLESALVVTLEDQHDGVLYRVGS